MVLPLHGNLPGGPREWGQVLEGQVKMNSGFLWRLERFR